MSYGIIYVVSNTINPMQYVGQTVMTPERRWSFHLGTMRTSYNHPFYNTMRKYGDDKFSVVQIDVADSPEELDEQETFHIRRLNTLWPNGYNLASGGRGGQHHIRSKQAMSKSRKGRSLSIEQRQNIAKALTNRYVSPETGRRISKSLTGKSSYM
jgi:group I intron endonuclease